MTRVGLIKRVAGLGLLAGLAYLAWAYTVGQPFDFHHLVQRQAFHALLHSPQSMSSSGVLEGSLIDRHSGRLDDTRLSALAGERRRLERWRDEVAAWDPESLTDQRRLTRFIAEGIYDGALERATYPWSVQHLGRVTYAIDHMHGPQTSLTRFMSTQHPVVDRRSAQRFVSRLEAFGEAFDGHLERARHQEVNGVLPPRFVVDNVIGDAERFIAPDPADNALVLHLQEALQEIDGIGDARRERLLADAETAMREIVYPAFARLVDYYRSVRPWTSLRGVWALPDGEAYYDTMLRIETTMDIDAEEVHRRGLVEVARIEAEMDGILRAQGLTDGSVGERAMTLGTRPEHLFSNDDTGREALIAYLEELLDDMRERQTPWFGTLPDTPVEVRRVPEYAEARQTIAYYGRPSQDGSRPGVYYINLRDTRDMPRWSLPSLTYHEAIPGHHLQIALAQEIDGLPLLRRSAILTGYVEGWALYAEHLAGEMGAYDDDPLGNLGRLQYAMWRAVRMVVDTGIHVKRWSKEEAIEYFRDKTGMSLTDATVEIERYFVTPGSAPAYLLGKLQIMMLRERAREALGDEFEIGAFHDVVLLNGPLPFTLLEAVVDDWISGQRDAT